MLPFDMIGSAMCLLFNLSHLMCINNSISFHNIRISYRQSIPYSPVNGEYKSLNNGGSSGGGGGGTDTRSGRESFDVLKCCDNIKTSTESNSPLNRCMARYRDEDYINCQFALVGCSFRTIDLNQLNIHNEENIYKHMNVS